MMKLSGFKHNNQRYMIFEINYQKTIVEVKKNMMMYEEYNYITCVGKTKQFDEKECEILSNLEIVIDKFITVLTNMSLEQFDEHYGSVNHIRQTIVDCDYDKIIKDFSSSMKFITKFDEKIEQFKMLL